MRLMQIMAGAKNGGAENFFMRLAPALARAGIKQHIVIRSHERYKTLSQYGIMTSQLKFGGKLDFFTKGKLQKLADQFKPDIIIAWMNRASAAMPSGDFIKTARLGGYYKMKYYKNCDYLIGNTNDICNYLHGEGWDRDKIFYLPNFVDNQYMPPLNRNGFNTPQDAPLLLGLGRLHKNKAFDIGIEALVKIPNAYYWIAGNGDEEAALKAQADKLGVSDRVRFLGWRDDVPALFSAADIFLCTSRHEPLGNMLIEAWAQETPIASVASQGPKQLIINGKNGLLSPIDDVDALANSVNMLINDKPLAVKIATAGAKSYQNDYTEAKVIAKYLEFFKNILEQQQLEQQ